MTEAKKLCTFCTSQTRHPLFLYFLIDKRVNLMSQNLTRDEMYVGLSSQPLEHLKCHNREKGYKAGVKMTKLNAGHWDLQLCMEIHRDAKKHKISSRKNKDTNKMKAVLKYLYGVAEKEKLYIFSEHIDMIKSFLNINNDMLVEPPIEDFEYDEESDEAENSA